MHKEEPQRISSPSKCAWRSNDFSSNTHASTITTTTLDETSDTSSDIIIADLDAAFPETKRDDQKSSTKIDSVFSPFDFDADDFFGDAAVPPTQKEGHMRIMDAQGFAILERPAAAADVVDVPPPPKDDDIDNEANRFASEPPLRKQLLSRRESIPPPPPPPPEEEERSHGDIILLKPGSRAALLGNTRRSRSHSKSRKSVNRNSNQRTRGGGDEKDNKTSRPQRVSNSLGRRISTSGRSSAANERSSPPDTASARGRRSLEESEEQEEDPPRARSLSRGKPPRSYSAASRRKNLSKSPVSGRSRASSQGRRASRKASITDGNDLTPPLSKENGSSHGRRLSRAAGRRLNASDPGDHERGDLLPEGGSSHGRPQRSRPSSSAMAPVEIPLADDGEFTNETFNLRRSTSGSKIPRGNARSCRRNLIKKQASLSELPQPPSASAPGRPSLIKNPPATTTTNQRPSDARLDGLLAKLRDPSVRNLGALMVDDRGMDEEQMLPSIPTTGRRGLLSRIAPMRHATMAED